MKFLNYLKVSEGFDFLFFSFKTFQPYETADRALEVSLDINVDSS